MFQCIKEIRLGWLMSFRSFQEFDMAAEDVTEVVTDINRLTDKIVSDRNKKQAELDKLNGQGGSFGGDID